MLVFRRDENRRTGEKPSKQGENQQQTQPTYGTGPVPTWATLMESERSPIVLSLLPSIASIPCQENEVF